MERRDVLSGRRILLGVTGSIAAYKAADILRRLLERGAEVRVAMTRHAAQFISPFTFETLSGMPVLCDEFVPSERTSIAHIDATTGLDAALIAPATANVIGKIASGIADDALTSALMALGCPLLIAPAMNDRMYCNAVLQRNIATLKELGVRFIEPGTGSLACGVTGQGRLAETDRIIGELSAMFLAKDLSGKTVLVTAGPTRESIDAVRFISNASSGKMGYALAAAARERGADVVLISGPTNLAAPLGVRTVPVVTAEEMRAAVLEQYDHSDVVIMAAAVSDFKPARPSARKIKKEDASGVLQLERTVDILKALGESGGKQFLVGFAAETDEVEQNALKKLRDKNLDMIVVNDLLREGSGFGTDTNAVTIFDRTGRRRELPTMPKSDVARLIVDAVAELMNEEVP